MFVNLRDAAHFCGYAPKTFRQMTKKYRIPKYGPTRTRFKEDDLVRFMEDPCFFLEQEEPLVRAKRKPQIGVTLSWR